MLTMRRWQPYPCGFGHQDSWREMSGFPTRPEFEAMKDDRAALERLGDDLTLCLLDPDGYYHPEPWWRDDG